MAARKKTLTKEDSKNETLDDSWIWGAGAASPPAPFYPGAGPLPPPLISKRQGTLDFQLVTASVTVTTSLRNLNAAAAAGHRREGARGRIGLAQPGDWRRRWDLHVGSGPPLPSHRQGRAAFGLEVQRADIEGGGRSLIGRAC